MAEIALQRDQYLTTAQEYLNAAGQSTDPELARRSTEYAFDYGYDVFALRGARRWAELDPDQVEAHEYLTRLYLRRNNITQAVYHADQALGPELTRSDDNYLELGELLAEEENAAGATTVLIRLRSRYPESSGMRLALARAAYQSGDYDLALVFAERAIREDDSEVVQPHILVGRSQVAMGNADLGLAHLESQLAESPNIALELEYVRLLGASGRSLAAVEVLKNLAEKYGIQPEFIRMHALISFSAGEFDAAARNFNQLLSAGANVYECFFYLGRIAQERGNHRSAIRFFSRIGAGPYQLPGQVAISRSYNQLGDPQTGLNQLTEFAKTNPRHAFDVLEPRAELLRMMGRDEEALRVYDTALQYKPDTIRLLIARGAVLERLNRLDDAVDSMRRAMELAPDDALTLNTLGYTLANRTRRHKEAYGYIRLALEREPDSAAIVDSMGWVLFRTGKKAEALSYLEQAYAMLPDPEVAAHLGEVLWTTDERDAATEVWARALAEYPDNEPLNETMERLLP